MSMTPLDANLSAWPPAPQMPTGPVPLPRDINGSLIRTLGILSFFFHPLGPVAWIMGNRALAAIARGEGDPAQLADVKKGRLYGLLNTVWMIFLLVFVVGAVLLVALMVPGPGPDDTRP